MRKTLIWLTVFSIAMGYMESAVVIYLRELYYPGGFDFPLAPLDARIGLVELLREASTIIMLLGIGMLTGKTASHKFANFIYCFAIWDLFYYVFLWVFLGWPESLFTWDILFLIPVPWVGPVITPCIVAVSMMLLALSIIYYQHKGRNTRLKATEWIMLVLGSLTIVLSFIWDYIKYAGSKSDIPASANGELLDELKDYIPTEFNWSIFLIGEAILLIAIALFIKRLRRHPVKNQKQL